MSGEITAQPWKPGRWRVYIPKREMPDGGHTPKVRKVVRAASDKDAIAWGRRCETELIREYEARRRGELERENPLSRVPTVAARAEIWLQRLVGDAKPSAIDAFESTVRIHITPHIGKVRLDQVTDARYLALRETWKVGGYQYLDQFGRARTVKPTSSQKTLNNRATALRCLLADAVEQAIIREMPCTIRVPTAKRTREPEPYSVEAYEGMVRAALAFDDARPCVAVLLGGDAGLRRGEIIALELPDVNFAACEITVRSNVYWRKSDEGREPVVGTPKGDEIKTIAVTSRLIAAIKRLVGARRTGRVLLGDDGLQMTPKKLRVLVGRVEKAVGLEPVGRIHRLRHSALTHLARAGATLIEVAAHARHGRDLRVTSAYIERARGAERSAVTKLEAHRATASVTRP